MIRIYIILALGAALIAMGFVVKHQIASNATLKANVQQLEGVLVETQDAVVFQQGLGAAKDSTAVKLRAEVKRAAAERQAWKGLYDEMLNKPENVQWANVPLPPDVRHSLRRDNPHPPDPVRARTLAEDVVQRLRAAAGAATGQEPRPAGRSQGMGGGDEELQRPAPPRS